ncbi:MAG: cobyrinate a,c-diamide synthase [Desulfobulbaceae bacterium]|nr:cobyrinate a,c-diamide synthase [Desulfobulbaceae bacterium]
MAGKTIKSLVVAGLSGGSGKSVVAVGLVAALKRLGRVIPFKKGPDYIDAGWLTTAAGHPCYNLDPFLMSREAVAHSFHTHAACADFAIIEGNRGLYDGVNAEGGFSTAELALQLDLPVLLVVNCSKTTRTVAAMVLGCRELDKRLHFAGVILNQIATPRHETIVRQAVEQYTGISVLGIVPRMKKDIFPMRHLGVTPHQEYGGSDTAVSTLAALAEEHFDLDGIVSVMQQVPATETDSDVPRAADTKVTIGILRDMAFQFYYEENLEALKEAGAELVMIDALQAEKLPDTLDGLYIGGGFPETSARQLAANASFRTSVRTGAELGLPIYAECGGLIFLGRSIILDGNEYPLAGVFPVTFGISGKPQAHGYSIFTADRKNPFYPVGTRVKGHEFRYSTVDRWDGNFEELVLDIERGTGFKDGRDGLMKNNVLALYTHVLAPGTPEWAKGIIKASMNYRTVKKS